MKPVVSGVSGQLSEMKSLFARRSSKEAKATPSSASAAGWRWRLWYRTVHVETAGAAGDLLADALHANDPQRAPGDFLPDENSGVVME